MHKSVSGFDFYCLSLQIYKQDHTMKDFIIEMAMTILGKAIQAKPDSKLAKILLNEKVKNTVYDLAKYYTLLELAAEDSEES